MGDTFALKVHDAKRAEKMRAARRKRREEIELSSGYALLLKPVSVFDLAASGEIPQTLSTIADEYTSGKTSIAIAEFPKFAPLIDTVVKACVMDPPIADVEDDEHLTLAEIPMEERIEIFRWANGDAAALEPFRAKPQSDVADVPAGDGMDAAPE